MKVQSKYTKLEKSTQPILECKKSSNCMHTYIPIHCPTQQSCRSSITIAFILFNFRKLHNLDPIYSISHPKFSNAHGSFLAQD